MRVSANSKAAFCSGGGGDDACTGCIRLAGIGFALENISARARAHRASCPRKLAVSRQLESKSIGPWSADAEASCSARPHEPISRFCSTTAAAATGTSAFRFAFAFGRAFRNRFKLLAPNAPFVVALESLASRRANSQNACVRANLQSDARALWTTGRRTIVQ